LAYHSCCNFSLKTNSLIARRGQPAGQELFFTMKTNAKSIQLTISRFRQFVLSFALVGLLFGSLLTGCADHLSPSPVGVITLANGLLAPLGMDVDAAGRVFVAEAGTGKNDSRISIISNGKVLPAITGFDSRIFQGEVAGVGHILFADGMLYITHDNGKLYKANLNNYKTGDAPLSAANIPSEDVGAFVKTQTLIAGVVTDNPDKDSHPYHMVIGPGGDLFITDAAANVIVRRNKTTGALSVFANIPGIKNPTPVGPPFIQSVPTGIVYDGTNLLVSGLMGFPFPAGAAQVYQVTPAGVVSVYKAGFNSLTGLDLNNGMVVMEYGTFGQTGWVANSGRLVRVGTPTNTVLTSGLNLPTALKKITANSYFVVSLGDASLLKVTF
jgi:hypothetical protein